MTDNERRDLGPGSSLAHYRITAKLGEGGMGEVWSATDTRLDREVAIKVLPAAFTADKERLARLEREAKLLAQLNHPNIAQIYGLESSGEHAAPSSWSSSPARRWPIASHPGLFPLLKAFLSPYRLRRRSRRPTTRGSSIATSNPRT